ncbi:hypothetical protein Tco_0677838 [Tanacetum coccineum]|uniref:Uncharacterized protein n=1 Tax=Tanacetum coccineum TaxID=301880 RepID=A0ABQ4XDC8_9ASTR
MRLYAISLSDSDLNSYSRRGSPKMAKCVEDKLLCNMEGRLTTVHGYLLSNDDNGMPMPADTRAYMSSYFTALKFLCKPISKLLISELEDALYRRELPNIEDAFQQFILVSRYWQCFKAMVKPETSSIC